MHAWLCEQPTGVDALQWRELPTPEPGPQQVRVAIRAASQALNSRLSTSAFTLCTVPSKPQM